MLRPAVASGCDEPRKNKKKRLTDSDGGDETILEGVLGEAKQQTSLAAAGVADQQYLDQAVVL